VSDEVDPRDDPSSHMNAHPSQAGADVWRGRQWRLAVVALPVAAGWTLTNIQAVCILIRIFMTSPPTSTVGCYASRWRPLASTRDVSPWSLPG